MTLKSVFFLTLVLIFDLTLNITSVYAEVHSTPDHLAQPAESQEPAGESETPLQSIEEENLVIVEPRNPLPSQPKKRADIYYPFHQSMSPHLGIAFMTNSDDEDDDSSSLSLNYTLGIKYMLPRYMSPHIEIDADLLSNGRGIVSGTLRWILFERSSFRPFYKVGIANYVDAKDAFGTFFDYKQYLVKLSGGFEDYFKSPLSIRCELDLYVGVEDIIVLGTIGYSWGW